MALIGSHLLQALHMDSWGWVTSTILFPIISGAALGTHPPLVPVALTLHGKLGAHESEGFFSFETNSILRNVPERRHLHLTAPLVR